MMICIQYHNFVFRKEKVYEDKVEKCNKMEDEVKVLDN
jgi:hypothetical protein